METWGTRKRRLGEAQHQPRTDAPAMDDFAPVVVGFTTLG